MESFDILPAGGVEVVYSPESRQVVSVKLDWQVLSNQSKNACVTVKDAVVASGLLERFDVLDVARLDVGVWGVRATLSTELSPSDRVEIYRDLLVDPKEARRLRFEKQRPKRALYRPGYRVKS